MFRIKARIRRWRAERKLKNSGYKSWAGYRHGRDPNVSPRAWKIKHFYHGYKYVYCFENRQQYAYSLLYDYGPGGHRYGYADIYDWCEEHARFTFRMDTHRVSKYYYSVAGEWDTKADEWEIDEMGGGDYLFVAFKDEKEYMMFLLRWA